MHSARRHATPLVALLAALAVAGCGGGTGNRTAVVTGPSQSAGPDTTGTPSPTAAASPSPTAQPTPTPTPTPTPAGPSVQPTPYYIPPSDANGAADDGSYLFPSATGHACGATQHHYDNCPVTARLAQRLDANPTPGAEPLCRCQNTWQSSSVSVTQTPDPSVWMVHVVLVFGPAATVKIDLLVRRTAAGWLADDTSCTGQGSQTSIYSAAPPPCPGS
ncbi:MAG TPA: hypothetical protein VFC09_12290 [Candidatus Dormibacteraeota bacterium]|nr:hypothetical protein [Candidatus Dormibacteraeota bacterium]